MFFLFAKHQTVTNPGITLSLNRWDCICRQTFTNSHRSGWRILLTPKDPAFVCPFRVRDFLDPFPWGLTTRLVGSRGLDSGLVLYLLSVSPINMQPYPKTKKNREDVRTVPPTHSQNTVYGSAAWAWWFLLQYSFSSNRGSRKFKWLHNFWKVTTIETSHF